MGDNQINQGKNNYKASEIESYWQKMWEEAKIYSPDLDKAKKPFYNLMMFPYPSAEGMHVGNMYAFTGADVYGRFMRMNGFDVFEPMGLDGFGIHSENYAIKVGQHPKDLAIVSEKNFYRQLRATGNGFDWSRKVETYDPNYYKWTQWLFIQLFKAGLAYRKKADVNFCPSCKTVLADEQVIQKVKGQKSKVKITTQKSKVRVDPRSNQRSSAKENQNEISINVCERCETEVVKKDLEQWFFRITKYADRLLVNIEKLDWSEKVKIAQRNWIGKSEGAKIKFKVQSAKFKVEDIEVFTTRPDTLYGATFLVLSLEHPVVGEVFKESSLARSHLAKLKEYVDNAKKKTEQERMAEGKEKTGVFSGLYAINPINQEKIPVWIADYVLMGYGTGAIMAVPAHDQRDFEFAKKYNLPVRIVIARNGMTKQSQNKGIAAPRQVGARNDIGKAFTGYGILIHSGEFSGLTSEEAIKRITAWLKDHKSGGPEITYHLRDWLISRQRYWGPPIPMIFCQDCAKKGKSGFTLTKKSSAKEDYLVNLKANSLNGWPDTLKQNIPKQNKDVNSQSKKGMDSPGVEPGRFGVSSQPSKPAEPMPESVYKSNDEFVNDWNSAGWFPVPEKDLPVLLPDVEDWRPEGSGTSPLANHPEFYKTECPNCKGEARRETDVSDTFLDSSWYFLRYLATDCDDVPFPSLAFTNSKFEARNSKQIRNSNVQNSKQFRISDFDIRVSARRAARWLPVNMYIGGAEHSVLHLLYSRFITMVLKDLGFIDFEEPFSRFYAHGLLVKEGAKMSKSKGNVVVPDEYIKKYGADTLRCYLMFLGPFNQGGDFYDTALEGMHKFLKRIWSLVVSHLPLAKDQRQVTKDQLRIMHKTIKKVTEDISNLRYNTAISSLMTYYNFLSRQEFVSKEEAGTFLKLLAPFAPHATEDLWQQVEHVDKVGKAEKTSTSSTSSTFSTFHSIHLQPWPTFDPKFLEEDEVTIVVQVNGKVRDTIRIKNQESGIRNRVEYTAKETERMKKYLEGKSIKKVVYVEGKIINFVT